MAVIREGYPTTAVEMSAADLSGDLSSGAASGCVALCGQKVVGYVIGYTAIHPYLGRFAFMEDLYVQEAHRKRGLGVGLWAHYAKSSLDLGFRRLDWNVLSWNPARDFYHKMGGRDLHQEDGIVEFRIALR